MKGVTIKHIPQRKPNPSRASKSSPDRFTTLLNKEITLFPRRFSDKVKEGFYLELSTLLVAGLNIKDALELIEAEQAVPRHADVIRVIKDKLIGGASLWEAMRDAGEFTPYEYFSIQIGEETGKLTVVLDQLCRYFGDRLKQRRQLVSALSYPVIILFTSIGAVAFMLLFIVPMFRDVFTRFGGDLPYLTKIIIDVSAFIQSYFWLFFLIVLGVVIFLYTRRQTPWFMRWSALIIMRIPVIGKIVVSLQLARLCASMSLLLGSKVSLIRALQLIDQMIVFFPIQSTLKSMEDDILHGEALHVSMAKFSIYNRRMVSLVKVGEEVNKLDVFFDRLSRQYATDAEHQTSLLNTFLEPAMIIFLGLVVGFILMAMYLPMFQMSTSIGG